MKPRWGGLLKLEWIAFAALLLFPLLSLIFPKATANYGSQLGVLFVFGILALGLNVVVGYTGLLHLGIAAFFGIGAYITGILTTQSFPFQLAFPVAVICSMLGAAGAGIVLGAPTLRLRGDYLALVTLGFGEVVRYSLRNLEEITNGTRAIGPIPAPGLQSIFGMPLDWRLDFRPFYFLNLFALILVVVVLKNLEASRLGRAWIALREDELAANCMGISTSRIRLSSFAVGAALAGLAGCLYAVNQGSTAQPDSYDFNRSTIMLCCVILGGLGSIRGTLLGVLLLIGFDNVLAPLVDGLIQEANINPNNSALLKFSNWRLMLFGLALILIMRFRPEGLFPAERVKEEFHNDAGANLKSGAA